jgi:hypothetical protein
MLAMFRKSVNTVSLLVISAMPSGSDRGSKAGVVFIAMLTQVVEGGGSVDSVD